MLPLYLPPISHDPDTGRVDLRASVADMRNAWHHVVVSHNGGTPSMANTLLYLDGVQLSTTQDVSTFSPIQSNIFRIGADSGTFFDGQVDLVRVYNRALTPNDIYKGPYAESYSYNAIGNITSKAGASYTYGSSRPHAVTQADATAYTYDGNGNMTGRGPQSLTWDAENSLSTVSGGASFVYDGDGKRVKKTENGETIVYVNKYYEKNVTTGVVTTYYYHGDTLVALRKGSTLEYVHQDHLGGSFVSTDGSGATKASITYMPFGATRGSSGTLGTDRKFTGSTSEWAWGA